VAANFNVAKGRLLKATRYRGGTHLCDEDEQDVGIDVRAAVVIYGCSLSSFST
jgi:hypothetical protein